MNTNNTNRQGQRQYDQNLCGEVGQPSPVWVANLDSDRVNYQVVTVFGATVDPRKR